VGVAGGRGRPVVGAVALAVAGLKRRETGKVRCRLFSLRLRGRLSERGRSVPHVGRVGNNQYNLNSGLHLSLLKYNLIYTPDSTLVHWYTTLANMCLCSNIS
jgi:hypothetical protein